MVFIMVLKDEEIQNETELEEILVNDPEQIEEGFKLLKTQRITTPYKKRLDVLGVDSKGTLTVIELKVREDE
jgi:RecB family endonuclease NucS